MRGFFIYALYRFIGALTGPLPPGIGYRLAQGAGWLLFHFSPRLREILSHNIGHVLGLQAHEPRVQVLARQACVNIAKGHYDLFRLNRLTLQEIEAMTRLEGREVLETALTEQRGIVLVSAHLGNVDLVGQLPLVYGAPVTSVAWHSQPERLFRHTLRLRSSHGLHLLPSDGPMLGLYRALKRGEIVCLAADRDTADNVRDVTFFDAKARLPDGLIRVARRTGAVLIPVFGLRLADDTFLVRVEKPLELYRSDDSEADIAATMEKIVALLERYISENPEQWLVAAPVWPLS